MKIRFLPKGFTLIELLIVVAIIAILAAIAVPNFIEAQMRAKVSRVKEDQRTLAVALEAFHVNHNWYPMDGLDAGGYSNAALDQLFSDRYNCPPWNIDSAADWPSWLNMWTIQGHPELTTPVAYLADLPGDPFSVNAQDPYFSGQMFYISLGDYMATGINDGPFPGMDSQGQPTEGAWTIDGKTDPLWYLESFGPDFYKNDDKDLPAYLPYDPSNGTTSYGDIFRAGP